MIARSILLIIYTVSTIGALVSSVFAKPLTPDVDVEGDSAAGHLTLKWKTTPPLPAGEFWVQKAKTEDFRDPIDLYRGSQKSSFISGLPDGTWYFRVRYRPQQTEAWSPWSDPCSFTVQHHSLRLALFLFAVGACVFVAMITFMATAQKWV